MADFSLDVRKVDSDRFRSFYVSGRSEIPRESVLGHGVTSQESLSRRSAVARVLDSAYTGRIRSGYIYRADQERLQGGPGAVMGNVPRQR